MSDGASVMAWLRQDLRRFDLAVATIATAIGALLVVASPDASVAGWPEVAAGIGAFVLVLFRRWKPMLLLPIAFGATATYVAIYERPTQLVFAALIVLATVCVRWSRWRAIGLGVAIGASLYVLNLISNDAELGDERAVIGIAWAAVAVGVADAVRSWRSYRQAADEQVRSAVLAADAQARQQVTEERLTIARELHDLLAHNLSVMNVQTGTALHLLHSNPEQAEASLVVARDAGRSVLDELRDLLGVLRESDSDGEPTSSLPTIDQIPALVETMRAAGLDVTWTRSGQPQTLSPAVSLAAYRIVQEGLTNAAKHGNGTAELTTSWEGAGLSIRMLNEHRSGRAESSVPGGHGLIGMRERAITNGGRFEQAHEAGRFIIDVWLPTSTAPATTEEP